MDAIDGWRTYEERQIREGFATRETDPNFPRLVANAKARGFEPAPLSALLATGNNNDLYTWQGRVWVKCKEELGQMSLAQS
ncbi:MAG: hypothetical protein H3C27_15725 [Opitutaceae bacterium]|nr:hypothetical protein [Opitutaceae bacterium]